MRVLITGICGFVGSSLAERLLEIQPALKVCGIDNLMRSGSENNRIRLRKLGVTFIHGDIRMASDFAGLPACDWVIDAAANPSVLAGTRENFSSRQLLEHNLQAMLNVLEYCKLHRCGLVLLSSSRVYSIAALTALPLREEGHGFVLDDVAAMPPGVSCHGIDAAFSCSPPVSLYGSTKLASEVLALEYGDAFGFPVWIDRCGVLGGAGQFGTPDQGIFAYWINAHLRRRTLRYIGFGGTGKQVRDVFHPFDLAMLVHAQMSNPRAGGQKIYTVGGGPNNARSLAAVTAWCDQRFGANLPAAEPQTRTYDVPWVVMDSTDAQRDFGWEPQMLAECIFEQIACHAEKHSDWLERSGL